MVAVADSGFSTIELPRDVGRHVCLVSRLRLAAVLYAPAPLRRPGTPGRPSFKGERMQSLKQRLSDPTMRWHKVTLEGWCDATERTLAALSGTALWHHPGMRLPIR